MKYLIFYIIFPAIVACATSNKKIIPAQNTSSKNIQHAQVANDPNYKLEEIAPSALPIKDSLLSIETCTKNADKRILSIEKKHNGCELFYKKSGRADRIAHSYLNTDHCFNIERKIREKLKKAGFNCL